MADLRFPARSALSRDRPLHFYLAEPLKAQPKKA